MTSIAARPVEAAASAEIATAIPAAAWKTLRVSHSSHRPDGDDDKLIQPPTESWEGHTARSTPERPPRQLYFRTIRPDQLVEVPSAFRRAAFQRVFSSPALDSRTPSRLSQVSQEDHAAYLPAGRWSRSSAGRSRFACCCELRRPPAPCRKMASENRMAASHQSFTR